MNADVSANHRAMEAQELTYHRLAHSHNDSGIWAELYSVPRPVTAHRHDFYEIAFTLGGSGQHEDEGGTLPFLLGDVWIVRPGQWHAFPLVAGAVRIFNLLLTPAFWSSCAALLRKTDRQLMASEEDSSSAERSSLLCVRHVRLSAQGLERVRPVLLTLAAELRTTETAGQVCLCAGLVLQVLGLLDRYGTSDVRQSAGMLAAHDAEGVLVAVRYIEAHYAEPLTLREVARQSCYAPTYLAHKFRKRLGVPPMEYLLQVRLQHACALLETTQMPVSTIACAVGFADYRYFATRFRHAFGVTPTRYRQRAGGQARHEAPTAWQNKMTNICRKIVGV
jgi:AraC family transcriptional regulator, L-rhamnose operon transcriptional activator RhaR